MASETLIIVVGGDYLAFEICKEILKTAGHNVVLVWRHDEDARASRLLNHEANRLAHEFRETFTFLHEDPLDPAALRRAGLQASSHADGKSFCLVAVSQDDRLNLRVSLLARDINEHVRITLRQFNPVLGHKIQEGLHYNCTAISPAAHAAATYAASAVDPSCFYALRFPTLESSAEPVRRRTSEDVAGAPDEARLFAFSERSAAFFGIAGMTVPQAEVARLFRIVSVNGRAPYLCRGNEERHDTELLEQALMPDDSIIAFGPVASMRDAGDARAIGRISRLDGIKMQVRDSVTAVRRTEPVLRRAATIGALVYVLFVAFFAVLAHWNVAGAMYYVMTTMAGAPDTVLCADCGNSTGLAFWQLLEMIGTVVATIVGIALVAIFTATVTSSLYAAAMRRTQGLRRIRRSGHIIVCGAGNVGSLVIDYLRQLGEQIVVVEKNPDSLLVELARDRKVDLLTGDATNDETIAFCSPETAKSLIGVTNSDTANLETALGARSYVRDNAISPLHVVLRIDDLTFGRSIKRHFGISSFSTTELTAATIAGLARFESTRGRFELFADTAHPQSFQLAERFQGPENAPPPAPPERPGYLVAWVPLYVWRENPAGTGEAIPRHNFAGEVRSGDRLLFMVPLDQFTN
ncbi:MAG: NAD-binding protein [Candidatus Eremiobacteraeota bacterium]|nr:NAD-binding protein [Candidatus Eremiobacteraeota bacterium]